MNIAFITGSLPPGRDGVGDYTRTLAAECLRRGHGASILALNDRHLTGREDLPKTPDQPAILRLGRNLTWPTRLRAARESIAHSGADCVSLQFVGYSFQNKGIPLGLSQRIQAIALDRPLQIMLHELWSGDASASFAQRLVGRAQRFSTLSLLRKTRPAIINTHVPAYRDTLSRHGISAKILPLFGNIPVAPLKPSASLKSWLRERSPGTPLPEGPVLAGGLFGSMYADWQAAPMLELLYAAARARGEHLVLLAAGHLGDRGTALWQQLAAEHRNRATFLNVGEQPPDALAEFFQLLDFCIATTPWHLLGKSSSAASMLDLGLPLVAAASPRFGFQDPELPAYRSSLIHRADHTLPAKLEAGLRKAPPEPSVSRVAEEFLAAFAVGVPR